MIRMGRIVLAVVAVCAVVAGVEVIRNVRQPSATPVAETKAAAAARKEKEYTRQMELQREILARWRKHDLEGDVRSPFYFVWSANMFKPFALKHLGSLEGRTVVEIGPGSSMIPAALYASAGARHYYGVDIFEHPAIRDALPYRTAFDLAKLDADYFVRDASEIILGEEAGKATLNPKYVSFLKRESFDTGLPDASVDYVLSMATIEHLNDPLKSIQEWKRILKPGGISAHIAGLADHRDFSKPYEYLKLDPAAWRAQFGPGRTPLHDFVNQWRPIDFKRAFEKAGFEILEYATEVRSAYSREQIRGFYPPTQVISDADWAQIAPAVREGKTREEVGQIFITIVVRKPALAGKAAKPR